MRSHGVGKDRTMNCSQCGREIHGSFCPVCGAPAPGHLDAATGVRLSGWWRRVGATVVDNLILVVPTMVAFLLVDAVAGALAGAIVSLAIQGVYQVKLLARPQGQTLGNRMVGTQVRDALTGVAISNQQALRRWGLVAIYSSFELAGTSGMAIVVSLIGAVDCLYPLFNARKQTLHDLFAGTIVVMI